MTPTSEQLAILDHARGPSNIIINALAGCGKTSTLELIERAVKTKPILYLVFNRKNADEAEGKMLSTTTVRTFNSLGHRIWAQKVGKVSLNAKKTQDILRTIIDEVKKPDQGPIWDSFSQIVSGVGLAKALGYVPDSCFPDAQRLISRDSFHHFLEESPDDLTSDLIDEVLKRSIIAGFAGNIDYNDQIYLPALFGGTYPKFPLLLVDEAQDLSPVNHAMVAKLTGSRRLIVVGDPWQNIYGFRGAKAGSMAHLQSLYSMTPTNLSISFRCPQAIVENARWRVPHFKWFKEGGYVEVLKELDPNTLPDVATIICRNNAPLFRTAFKLLAMGRSVNVSGSDIGPKLVAMMKKLGDSSMSRSQTLSAIGAWLDEKLSRESKTADDMAACMRVFAEHGATLGQAISYAEHLFQQRGTILLTTGHKAKGLEWPVVYHLDPWLLGEHEQDLNLRYVINTRSADRYYEINSGNIKW